MLNRRFWLCLTCISIFASLIACQREQNNQPIETGTAAPHQGGEIVVGLSADLSTFNEYQTATESNEHTFRTLIFPTLVAEQNDYSLHPPSFAPAIASSWEFSDDNRTLTFHLRPEVRWSDGTPLTSKDVLFTYGIQKNESISPDFVEIKEYIERVEAVDPVTVRFHFSRVYPYQLMDANDGFIVPEHVWGKIPLGEWPTADFEKNLVTCGPYRVVGHVRDQSIVLERDPLYWNAPKPFVNRIVARVIPDTASQLAQLLSGQIHLVNMVPPREADRLKDHRGIQLVEFPSRLWGYVGWNNRHPLFKDRRVRRALSLAINRKALVDTVYFGHASLAQGPVLSSFWAFDKDLPQLPYDIEQARKLMKDAGWIDTNADGCLDRGGQDLSFEILYPSTNQLRAQAALMIQADLARIGIKVQPAPVEFTTMLAREERGDFLAILNVWEEASKIELASIWATPGPGRGANNFIGYSNPEVDRMLSLARSESDFVRAKALFHTLQKLIVEDQPVTFLYEAPQLVGLSRHIRNADINSASIFFNVDEWYWAD